MYTLTNRGWHLNRGSLSCRYVFYILAPSMHFSGGFRRLNVIRIILLNKRDKKWKRNIGCLTYAYSMGVRFFYCTACLRPLHSVSMRPDTNSLKQRQNRPLLGDGGVPRIPNTHTTFRQNENACIHGSHASRRSYKRARMQGCFYFLATETFFPVFLVTERLP